MSAMLIATVLAGVATSRMLMALGLRVFAIRYALAVIVAYAVFVGSVKLWLVYIGFCAAVAKRRHASSSSGDWFDCFEFSSGGTSSSSSGGGGSLFSEGGGKFGGGGASGSWGSPQPNTNTIVPSFLSSSNKGSSSKSSSKSGDGGGDDLGELVLVVLIIALVIAVIATFVWLIWAAPAILSEAAFNAVLAGALVKHAHNASHGSWVGSIIRKTRIPFALILVLAILVGWWAQKYCPGANRLSEAVHCVQPAM